MCTHTCSEYQGKGLFSNSLCGHLMSAKSRNRVFLEDSVLKMKNRLYFKNPLTFLCHRGPKFSCSSLIFQEMGEFFEKYPWVGKKWVFLKAKVSFFLLKIGGNFPKIVFESVLNRGRGSSEISEHACITPLYTGWHYQGLVSTVSQSAEIIIGDVWMNRVITGGWI